MSTSGLKPNSANLFQIIKEATPGTYDAQGDRYLMSSLRVEPQEEQSNDFFKPQGWNARAWNAVTRLHSVISGSVRLDFAQVDILLSLLCGEPVSDEISGDYRERVYRLAATGADERETYTAEYGTRNEAARYAYLLLQSLSLNFMRMTENNEGSVTLLARKASAYGVNMTGMVAMPTIFTLTADATTQAVGVTMPATSLGSGGVVTVNPGNSAADVKAAIEALTGYTTAGVSGALTTTPNTNVKARMTPLLGANNAFDGNNGTNAPRGQAVVWDCGDVRGITGIDFRVTDGDNASFILEQDDNDSFSSPTQVGSVGTAGGQFNHGITLNVAHTERYLRLSWTPNPTGNNLGISEITPYAPVTSGTLTITITSPQEAIGTPTEGTARWSIERTQSGADGVLAVPALVPILPQMWTARRAAAYADLAGATPISRMRGFGLDLPDRALLQWFFDDSDVEFDDWVQGEGEVMARLTLVNETDGVCADLVEKARDVPATPEWWQFKAQHPDLDYMLAIDGFFAVSGNIPYGTEGNVRHREFPLSAMLNDQGWLLQITTRVPA